MIVRRVWVLLFRESSTSYNSVTSPLEQRSLQRVLVCILNK